MKILTKILSLFLAFIMIAFGASTIFKLDAKMASLLLFITKFLTMNIIPLATIAIASIGLCKEKENTISRITVFYMLISIILSIYLAVSHDSISSSYYYVKDSGASFYTSYYKFYNLFTSLHSAALVITLISIIDVNNSVSSTFKKLSYTALVVNGLLRIYSSIESLVKTLPSYSDEFFSLRVASTSSFVSGAYLISNILLIFGTLLLYITNYAFSEENYVTEDTMDFDELKDQAQKLNLERMNKIYNPTEEKPVYEESNTSGININNQLNYGSNVGAVKEQAKEINVVNTSLNSVLNMNSGPVVNENINNSNNVVENENKNI